jgi:hypothetical protein
MLKLLGSKRRTTAANLSVDFWKSGVERYKRYQRGQFHQERGDYHLALRAYEGAGALRSAAAMRALVNPSAPASLDVTGGVRAFDAFWAERWERTRRTPSAA